MCGEVDNSLENMKMCTEMYSAVDISFRKQHEYTF